MSIPTTRVTGQDDEDLRHMLRRAGAGINDVELEHISTLGWHAWLEEQLEPMSIADPAGDHIRKITPMAWWDAGTVWRKMREGAIRRNDWDCMFEVSMAAMGLQCWSSRHLYEHVVDFYGNHLNVTCPSGPVWQCRGDYELNVLRKYSLAPYHMLLTASSRHAAMLIYLNADRSTKNSPNENYARELLELHTVGVGNFSEADMSNAARLFTGWKAPVAASKAYFEPGSHDTGAMKILGYEIPEHRAEDGPKVQADFLRWLANHPATARNISRKLAIRFVSDDPSEALLGRLAEVWRNSEGYTRSMLRAIFLHPEFWESKGAKLRRPMEDLAATVTALKAPPPPSHQALSDLYWLMPSTGHQPYRRQSPDGYPDVASAWQSSGAQLTMWNIHVLLGSGTFPRTMKLPESGQRLPERNKPKTPRQLVDHLQKSLFLDPFSEKTKQHFYDFMGMSPDEPLSPRDGWLNGAYPRLIALALNTPRFRVR